MKKSFSPSYELIVATLIFLQSLLIKDADFDISREDKVLYDSSSLIKLGHKPTYVF